MGVLLRVLWFVFVGWWLGLLWLFISIVLMLSLIGFPIGAYMATKTWNVATFKTSPRTVVIEAQQQR